MVGILRNINFVLQDDSRGCRLNSVDEVIEQNLDGLISLLDGLLANQCGQTAIHQRGISIFVQIETDIGDLANQTSVLDGLGWRGDRTSHCVDGVQLWIFCKHSAGDLTGIILGKSAMSNVIDIADVQEVAGNVQTGHLLQKSGDAESTLSMRCKLCQQRGSF